MRVTFFYAEKGYELALGPLLAEGAASHGDTITLKPLAEYDGPETDASLICGVVKREVLWDHQAKGHPLMYLDKGFHRTRAPFRGMNLPGWWRICLNDTHPTAYMMARNRPPDRFRMLGVTLAERKVGGKNIVILGSSAKFHHTMHLPDPTTWASQIVAYLEQVTSAQIVYRPKPSWSDAQPIQGAMFDHGMKNGVGQALDDAICTITYGSIASVDSIIAGVPCVVLGNAPAAPVSSRHLNEVLGPIWESRMWREQWAANLCYSHFTPEELANGTAWGILKETMRHAL